MPVRVVGALPRARHVAGRRRHGQEEVNSFVSLHDAAWRAQKTILHTLPHAPRRQLVSGSDGKDRADHLR